MATAREAQPVQARVEHVPADVPSLQPARLHSSESVVIFDVACRPHDHGLGAEEFCAADQIVFPRRGVFVRHVAGEDVVADANHALFFARGETHRVSHPARCGDDCTVFAFAPALVRDCVLAQHPQLAGDEQRLLTTSHVTIDPRVYLLQARLRQVCLQHAQDMLAIDEAALALLEALVTRANAAHSAAGPRRAATTELHREQSRRTKLFLASTFHQPLALDDVARAVHCSVYHLARVFRRETGLSIHQYRHRLRLRASLERLLSGANDLSELAQELGFSSHSHFSDAFRAAFGLAPSACRRAVNGRRLRELSKNLEV